MNMQNNTITDLVEILSYINTTIHTFAALFEKILETISDEVCEKSLKKERIKNRIYCKFSYGNAVPFVYITRYYSPFKKEFIRSDGI